MAPAGKNACLTCLIGLCWGRRLLGGRGLGGVHVGRGHHDDLRLLHLLLLNLLLLLLLRRQLLLHHQLLLLLLLHLLFDRRLKRLRPPKVFEEQ